MLAKYLQTKKNYRFFYPSIGSYVYKLDPKTLEIILQDDNSVHSCLEIGISI